MDFASHAPHHPLGQSEAGCDASGAAVHALGQVGGVWRRGLDFARFLGRRSKTVRPGRYHGRPGHENDLCSSHSNAQQPEGKAVSYSGLGLLQTHFTPLTVELQT